MFRFLHAADIHLDSPLRGLERYPDAPVENVRSAPRRAFENLVGLAIEEEVAFVLLAGDLYDGDWKDYNTGLFFVAQMRRLEAAGIPVHLVSGNHDAASQITRRLRIPSNVKHYPHDRPQTTEIPELDVAIHGQSFAGRSVSDDLSAAYPQAEADRFEIGLLHTSLDGRPGHADYAPCTVDGLRAKGYDYWALGHVHQREVIGPDPWIVFPGNIQGRHAREAGPKGCSLVRVEHGEVAAVEQRDLDVVRWSRVEVDLSRADSAEESVDRVQNALGEARGAADGRLLASRIVLCGRSGAHDALARDPERWIHEFREQASALGAPGVWIEKVVFDTRRPIDLGVELEREDALGDLMRMVAALDDGPLELASPLEEIAGHFADLKKKLPARLLSGEDAFDPTRPETLRARLPAVRDLLLARLLDVEERA
ncbi:MAG: DNA repair exonuclease [Deltaproteobacteria bacterium]|nr:DNA repair exonuclease [Deltaproteobacteria bacterium]